MAKKTKKIRKQKIPRANKMSTIKKVIDEEFEIGKWVYKDKIVTVQCVSNSPAERVKNLYNRRKKHGKCINCGKRKASKNNLRCPICIKKYN